MFLLVFPVRSDFAELLKKEEFSNGSIENYFFYIYIARERMASL